MGLEDPVDGLASGGDAAQRGLASRKSLRAGARGRGRGRAWAAQGVPRAGQGRGGQGEAAAAAAPGTQEARAGGVRHARPATTSRDLKCPSSLGPRRPPEEPDPG